MRLERARQSPLLPSNYGLNCRVGSDQHCAVFFRLRKMKRFFLLLSFPNTLTGNPHCLSSMRHRPFLRWLAMLFPFLSPPPILSFSFRMRKRCICLLPSLTSSAHTLLPSSSPCNYGKYFLSPLSLFPILSGRYLRLVGAWEGGRPIISPAPKKGGLLPIVVLPQEEERA